MWKKWKQFWRAFIPQKVSNACVLWVMQVLSYVGRVSKKQQKINECENRKLFLAHSAAIFAKKYIENQQDWGAVRFGQGKNHNMSHSGCGIIAAYNALNVLEETTGSEMKSDKNADRMLSLIRFFEQKGAVLGGRIGIAPKAIVDYFKKQGYDVTYTKCGVGMEEDQLNALGNNSDVTIATIYNNQMDIFGRIHNICITKEKGRFFAHNIGRRKEMMKAGCATLWDAIMNSASSPKIICVIGICKRENNYINS